MRCAWSLSSILHSMPMWRDSPVIFISTTSCSMNHSRTKEACFKAYLRYLSTIRKCVTIWQEDNLEPVFSYVSGSQGSQLRCNKQRAELHKRYRHRGRKSCRGRYQSRDRAAGTGIMSKKVPQSESSADTQINS